MRVQQILRTIVIIGLWLALFSMTMEAKTKVTSQPFGKMPDGTPIEIFTLSDGAYEARIATYGGVVVSLKAPDRNGKVADVVLGFDDADGYVANFNGACERIFRSHYWPLCKSHRARQLYARWQQILPASEQWREHSSRRPARLQQCSVESEASRGRSGTDVI